MVPLSRLNARAAHGFDFAPSDAQVEKLCEDLGLIGLRKARISGRIEPMGARDWRLVGQIGATVTQPCVVTLAPVRTRIEAPVERRYVEGYRFPSTPEAEMDADDSLEPLPEKIDLLQVLTESLALSLPDYPRAEGAAFEDHPVPANDTDRTDDKTARPFAGLKALRQELTEKDE